MNTGDRKSITCRFLNLTEKENQPFEILCEMQKDNCFSCLPTKLPHASKGIKPACQINDFGSFVINAKVVTDVREIRFALGASPISPFIQT